MKRLIPWAFITLWMALVMIAACDSSPTAPDATPADTVYVYPQVWVGIEFMWAGEILNNDVQQHIAAGWVCGEPLLEHPQWFPLNADLSNWLIVHERFYVCYAPVPGIDAPLAVSAMAIPERFGGS